MQNHNVVIRYLRLPPSKVLLAPDVGARGVEDPPLAPLQPGTPRVHFLQRDLVHARQPIRLGVPDRRGIVSEELFTISSSMSYRKLYSSALDEDNPP